MFELGNYDLVFLYREAIPLGPPLVERFIAKRGVPIVYDFDDAIFLPSVSEANRSISFLKDPGKVAADPAHSARRSWSAMSSSRTMRAGIIRHVTVIPTAVDTDRFVPRTERTGRPA